MILLRTSSPHLCRHDDLFAELSSPFLLPPNRSLVYAASATMSLLSAREKFMQAEKDKEKKDKTDKKDKDRDVSSPLKSSSKPSSSGSSSAAGSTTSAAAGFSKVDASKSDDELVAEALKRGEWKEQKDEKSGRNYYYNPKTKATTWDLKKELRKLVGPAPTAAGPTADAASATQPAAPTQQPAAAAAAQPPAVEPTRAATPTAAALTAAAVAPAVAAAAQPAVSTSGSFAASGRPPTPTSAAAASVPPSGSALPAAVSGTGGMLPSGILYQDPVQRLLDHNEQLLKLSASQQSGSGPGLSVAMDFQAKYDAMVRTNQALSAQLERMKTEHDAMARALVESNKKIHELQLLLSAPQTVLEKSRDDDLYATMAHLRESNRILVTQVSELSMLLARGFNEAMARLAEATPGRNSGVGMDDVAAGGSSATGASLITRFLDTAARHTLCPNCVLSVTRFRDKLLTPVDSNVGRIPRPGPVLAAGIQPNGPIYEAVPDYTTPPASHYFNAAQMQPSHLAPGAAQPTSRGLSSGRSDNGAGAQTAAASSPAVIYGGFVVRNPRVPS